MKVSVVLTTYNGMKYLVPLLDSLRNQSRTIDEVLICDDCSTDGTRELVDNYISEHKLANWVEVWNKTNQGWRKNFRDGIIAAKGDIIFPCDQDDIWEKDKVKIMSEMLESRHDIELLCGDYKIQYEVGSHKTDDCHTEENLGKLEKILLDNRFSMIGRPGCVMAVRKTLVDIASNMWEATYAHDAFMWTISVLRGSCYILHVPVITFRRHSNNTSTNMSHKVEGALDYLNRTSRLVRWRFEKEPELSAKEKEMLEDFLIFSELRIGLLAEHKLANWFRLFKYKQFYRTTKQKFGDLYLFIKRN